MKSIWKFQLETTDIQSVVMPINAKILSIQTQNNKPCILAEVDVEADREERAFQIFGTGHFMTELKDEEYRRYIGTYQLNNGQLVFHCYEYFFKLPFLNQHLFNNN